MSTTVRLTISNSAGGTATATAQLFDEAAPVAVAKFVQALPISQTLRHVRWSGEAGYVLVDALRDPAMALENRMSFFCRGTIGLRPEHGEVAIAYGSAQARDWWGIGWASRVAELTGDTDAFLEAVRATQAEGGAELVISKEG